MFIVSNIPKSEISDLEEISRKAIILLSNTQNGLVICKSSFIISLPIMTINDEFISNYDFSTNLKITTAMLHEKMFAYDKIDNIVFLRNSLTVEDCQSDNLKLEYSDKLKYYKGWLIDHFDTIFNN